MKKIMSLQVLWLKNFNDKMIFNDKIPSLKFLAREAIIIEFML